MKTKLTALIAEQKALTAKFEELLNEPDIHKTNGTLDYNKLRVAFNALMETYTTEELIECAERIKQEQSIDPKKVYIKGHPTRGAEVIKMLEDLGGVNKFNWDGTRSYIIYRIRHEDNVILSTAIEDLRYTPCNIELHLPEEVELIEGEVYQHRDRATLLITKIESKYAYILAEITKDGAFVPHTAKSKVYVSDLSPATPKQRKQLFDALKKAGKHFNKENMRLLDVEECALIDDETEAIEDIKEMRLQEEVDKIKADVASRICEFVLDELSLVANKIGVEMTAIEFSCELYSSSEKRLDHTIADVNYGV